jgi:hypothetical protein
MLLLLVRRRTGPQDRIMAARISPSSNRKPAIGHGEIATGPTRALGPKPRKLTSPEIERLFPARFVRVLTNVIGNF